MNSEDIYRDWLEAHRKIEASPGFTKAVMDRVDRLDAHPHERVRIWSKRLETLAESPWAQAAAVAVATAMGLGRILLTLHVLSFG